MTKQKRNVGFGMVFAGLVFFFNPNVQLFDVLPDVIGALLIYFGLKNAAEAGAYFDDARKVSFSLIWLYVLKSVLAFSLLRYPDNALPYTFLAGVVEAIALISFFAKLYDGFEYASMRSSNNGETAKYVKDVRAMSYIFVISRSVLAFVPEILELLQQNDEVDLSANAAYRMPIIRLKPYVLLFCVTVALLLGILYLVRTGSFFARVKKDAKLADYLSALYTDAHQNDRELYASRAFGTSLLWLAAAGVFAVDFTLDGVDVLIDLAGWVCMLAAFAVLSRFDGKKMPVLPLALYAVASAASTAVNTFVRPTAFRLLTGAVNGKAEEFANVSAVAGAVIVGICYAASAIFLMTHWTKRGSAYCQAEKLGNYDSKFLSCSLLFILTAVGKVGVWVLEALRAHLACEDEVAKHLAARSHMSVARFSESVSQSGSVALFETLDGIAPVVSLVALALAFFTVIAVLSFKAASAHAFDPNAEE